jgi:hypothetical protein
MAAVLDKRFNLSMNSAYDRILKFQFYPWIMKRSTDNQAIKSLRLVARQYSSICRFAVIPIFIKCSFFGA